MQFKYYQTTFTVRKSSFLHFKAAGTFGETHLKNLSEIFTEEQLKNIPVDNKVGENYFGHLFQQLKEQSSKGGSAFQAISDRLKNSAQKKFRSCIW